MNENEGTNDVVQWFSEFSTEVPAIAESSYWQTSEHQGNNKEVPRKYSMVM